jgi:hypothetical protein
VRLGPCGQQDQQGAGNLDEVEPAQQGDAATLPHGPQAINHLKITEQGLDAPPLLLALFARQYQLTVCFILVSQSNAALYPFAAHFYTRKTNLMVDQLEA